MNGDVQVTRDASGRVNLEVSKDNGSTLRATLTPQVARQVASALQDAAGN